MKYISYVSSDAASYNLEYENHVISITDSLVSPVPSPQCTHPLDTSNAILGIKNRRLEEEGISLEAFCLIYLQDATAK